MPKVEIVTHEQIGAPGGVASLDAGGKLPAAQLPDLAVTQFLGSTASQAAMLALVGQRGDWTVRTDLGTTWIVTAEPSNVIGSWTQLSYPAAPVTTVAGKAGAVTLVSADISDATAAATANMVARRDAAGRLAVAAGDAAGDAANVGQLTSFGRDRGSGTTLPSTDLRRGDVYHHSAWACLLIYNGGGWRQTHPGGVADPATRDANTTTYANALHDGFRVRESTTGWLYQWNGSAWRQAEIPTVTGADTTAGVHADQLRMHPTWGMQRWDGAAWKNVSPYQMSVKGQPGGSIAPGHSNILTLTIPDGRAMPSTNYVVHASARETATSLGGAEMRVAETISQSTTQFVVRVVNTYSASLPCYLDYTLTEVL